MHRRNSEIYNHQQIRDTQLAGIDLHSKSDSAIIGYLYQKWVALGQEEWRWWWWWWWVLCRLLGACGGLWDTSAISSSGGGLLLWGAGCCYWVLWGGGGLGLQLVSRGWRPSGPGG